MEIISTWLLKYTMLHIVLEALITNLMKGQHILCLLWGSFLTSKDID